MRKFGYILAIGLLIVPEIAEDARMGDVTELGRFIDTVRSDPRCDNGAIGSALGVVFEQKNGSGPFKMFEAKGSGDVARFELRQPGEGATAPGIFIAHLTEGRVTRDALMGEMKGAETIELIPNPRANPPVVEESFELGDTQLHATYQASEPRAVLSVAWHCK